MFAHGHIRQVITCMNIGKHILACQEGDHARLGRGGVAFPVV
jgi:hypothetical protein